MEMAAVHQHRAPSPAKPVSEHMRPLRDAVVNFCAAGLVPAPLCEDAQALCDEADAGLIPADHAADETRALLGGLALLSRGVGQRCCRVADALLADLSRLAGVPWAGCTVPGGEDRANARTGMVELRFPAADVWAIPAVGHEMGHILARAPQLGRKLGTANPARRVIAEGSPERQREELFCDFYATYVTGPAYPALMILDRLNPSLAAPERPFPDDAQQAATHPTPDKRVLVMLSTLRALDRAAGPLMAPHAEAREFLEARWQERLDQAGTAVDPHGGAEKMLDFLVNRLWAELDPVLDCRFTTPMAARDLVEALRAGNMSSAPAGVRVLDVIVAGWLARIRPPVPGWAGVEDLAARTLTIAVSAAERAGQAGERR